jgi:hypothetical protein
MGKNRGNGWRDQSARLTVYAHRLLLAGAFQVEPSGKLGATAGLPAVENRGTACKQAVAHSISSYAFSLSP